MRPDRSPGGFRRRLRALPANRRQAVARAIRNGRAVEDPRDAPLAVEWAQRIESVRMPRWILPRKRPHGLWAVLWLLHGTWIAAVVVTAIVIPAWRAGGLVRWVVIGAVAYSAISVPWVVTRGLQMRWNAAEAGRRNRDLSGDGRT
jgi:hypothetical protein